MAVLGRNILRSIVDNENLRTVSGRYTARNNKDFEEILIVYLNATFLEAYFRRGQIGFCVYFLNGSKTNRYK